MGAAFIVIRPVVLLALAALAGCASRAPSPSETSATVADAALRGGSPQIALRLSTEMLESEPGNIRALMVQGDALTAMGDLGEAAGSYRAVLSRDPANVRAEIGLGRALLTSDPAAAEALFAQAVHYQPRNAIALVNLGVARDLQKRHSDAQIAYRDALGVDPASVPAQVNLALSLAMSGRGGEAVAMIRPLAGADASAKLHHDYAAVLVMAGQRDEAARILSADMPPDQVNQAIAAYRQAMDNPAALSAVP